jgi:zinc transport system substrate-binding protein
MRTFLLCIVLLIGAAGCQKPQAPSSAAKPTVLVSVPSYLYFIERIAGDTVEALSLTPAGANPHIYEPTPKEVQKMRRSALWIRLGEPSDQKTYTVLAEQDPKMRIVDITEGISLLANGENEHSHHPHHCEHHDPLYDRHIWLSPRLAEMQARTIAQHLSELLPENRERYESALAALIADLHELDEEVTALLATKRGSAILVSHPAFAYFCRDYQLEQLSIEVEGKDPLPQDITHLLEQAKEHQIARVIAEPQYSDKSAQLIAEHLQLPVCVVDPYSPDYLKNIRYLAEVVAKS